jgi:hypothetical protein
MRRGNSKKLRSLSEVGQGKRSNSDANRLQARWRAGEDKMKKLLFATITKADETRREVHGTLVEEAVDKDGEIFDYATSKPFFEKWNSFFEEKTDGKSVGNLRAMHTKIAAGKFIRMDYDDASKVVRVVAKVTDDDQWKNVCEGVYTGFSIGARVVGKKFYDKAADAWRWTADPYEGSLVDNPAMYGTTFSRVCADGAQEQVKFIGSDTTREKGLYTVGYFAQLCDSLLNLSAYMAEEEDYEDDSVGMKLAAEIRGHAKSLAELLVKYTKQEVGEATADKENNEMADKPKGANKAEAGERPNAAALSIEPGVRPTTQQKVDAAPAATPAAAAAPDAPAKTLAELKADREALDKQIVEEEAKAAPAAAETVEAADMGAVEKLIKASEARFEEKLKSATEKFELAEKRNAELTETLTKANEALKLASEKLGRAVPTPVNIKGVVAVKEKDGVSAEADKTAITKDDTPTSAIAKIHARGYEQPRA